MDLSQTRPFSYNEMTPSRAAANRRRGKRRSQTSREAPGKHQSAQEELLVDEPDSGQSEDELLHVSSIIPRQVAGKRHFAVRIIRALTDWFSLRFGGNWVLLTLLGVVTALVAFAMDFCIRHILQLRFAMISYMASFPAYVAWLLFTVGLALFAVATTHYLEEHAIGSGIPQMKAIIQGTRIFNYLSQRTLLSKFVGTTFASGSGLPVGKEGPFVHMASIIAEQLMQMLFRVVHSNTTQRLEMLAAAAAVGVASNFGAPIGGVLFSIEVTSTYFAVRNYWRGFYASVVGAFVFRLLAVLIKDERTLTALFTTQFDEYPFDMQEMFAFTLVGRPPVGAVLFRASS